MFSCWGFQTASDLKYTWSWFKGLIQSPAKAMERLHWFQWAWGQAQLFNHNPILPSPKIRSLQIKINNRIIQNFVYRIQKVTVVFFSYKIQLSDSIFISHMYKYNPNNMILLFLPKYYYFLVLFLFHFCLFFLFFLFCFFSLFSFFFFFLQKFTKQIILYIYNPILWRALGRWWKIDSKGSALNHCKERKTKTLTQLGHRCSEERTLDSSFGSKKSFASSYFKCIRCVFTGLQWPLPCWVYLRQDDVLIPWMPSVSSTAGWGQQAKAQHWIQHWVTA